MWEALSIIIFLRTITKYHQFSFNVFALGQQDGDPLLTSHSPAETINLAAIHGQKFLYRSFGLQVGDCEPPEEGWIEKTHPGKQTYIHSYKLKHRISQLKFSFLTVISLLDPEKAGLLAMVLATDQPTALSKFLNLCESQFPYQ